MSEGERGKVSVYNSFRIFFVFFLVHLFFLLMACCRSIWFSELYFFSLSSLSFLLAIKNRAAISGENCERATASFGAVMFFFLFSGSFLLFLCRSNDPFSSHITSGVSHSRPRQKPGQITLITHQRSEISLDLTLTHVFHTHSRRVVPCGNGLLYMNWPGGHEVLLVPDRGAKSVSAVRQPRVAVGADLLLDVLSRHLSKRPVLSCPSRPVGS